MNLKSRYMGCRRLFILVVSIFVFFGVGRNADSVQPRAMVRHPKLGPQHTLVQEPL